MSRPSVSRPSVSRPSVSRPSVTRSLRQSRFRELAHPGRPAAMLPRRQRKSRRSGPRSQSGRRSGTAVRHRQARRGPIARAADANEPAPELTAPSARSGISPPEPRAQADSRRRAAPTPHQVVDASPADAPPVEARSVEAPSADAPALPRRSRPGDTATGDGPVLPRRVPASPPTADGSTAAASPSGTLHAPDVGTPLPQWVAASPAATTANPTAAPRSPAGSPPPALPQRHATTPPPSAPPPSAGPPSAASPSAPARSAAAPAPARPAVAPPRSADKASSRARPRQADREADGQARLVRVRPGQAARSRVRRAGAPWRRASLHRPLWS